VGELHPLKISQGPWQEISIDIIGPLPKSNRKDAIMVIVDRFTKMIRLKATTINVSSEEIAKIYWNDVTNFIQLVSLQPVDQFSQTKLHWNAPNEGYPHMCGMHKSDNK